ncbi:WAP four-disulfide core domain protein 18-like [Mus caroli]|uniref:WAP four-disulfide core domain protein 18-like n=1 Tax=Mus caroli TaxID=10089 RepID=A0A6P5QKA7_MUSCR|nr:WAP four-disulfide core domain protein 18-like [Mus caroli]
MIGTILFLVALIIMGMNITCVLSSPKKLEKLGACPKISPGSDVICVELCAGDQLCPGQMKCCSNVCGHICKSPGF